MPTNKELMNELHAIREQIYEDTKHMTPAERSRHVRKEVDEGLAKLGIKLRRVMMKEEVVIR